MSPDLCAGCSEEIANTSKYTLVAESVIDFLLITTGSCYAYKHFIFVTKLQVNMK